MEILEFSQGCELCHNQCWMRMNDGRVVHPCCVFWYEHEGKNYCEACRASAQSRHQDRERAGYRAIKEIQA